MESRPIETVLAERTEEWMALEGVTGTAIGLCDDEPCIVVFLLRDSEELVRQIPTSVEGYPVDIRVSGTFRALDPP